MNGTGTFLGHLVRAIGYAVVGAEEDSPPASRTATRRSSSSVHGATRTKGKPCCTAKRVGASATGATEKPQSAPIATAPSASFGTMRPLRAPVRK